MSLQAKQTASIQYLMGKHGLPLHQAAGIIGNFTHESGLNTSIVGDKQFSGINQAVGAAQWRGDRRKQFRNLFGFDLEQASLEQQLDYAMWEMRNTEKPAGDKLFAAKDLGSAIHAVRRYYERPKNRPEEDKWRYDKVAAVYTKLAGSPPAPLQQMPEQFSQPAAPVNRAAVAAVMQPTFAPAITRRDYTGVQGNVPGVFAPTEPVDSNTPLRNFVQRAWNQFVAGG